MRFKKIEFGNPLEESSISFNKEQPESVKVTLELDNGKTLTLNIQDNSGVLATIIESDKNTITSEYMIWHKRLVGKF